MVLVNVLTVIVFALKRRFRVALRAKVDGVRGLPRSSGTAARFSALASPRLASFMQRWREGWNSLPC